MASSLIVAAPFVGVAMMGPRRGPSPTRETAIGLEEFRGDTVGTVWATTATAATEPTPTRLLKASMPASAERWSRLRTAAFEGKRDHVEKLTSDCTKAELDTADKAGWTALMYAARGGHLDVARLLLERGASVNASNSKGWTALMFASWLPTPNERLVRCLMQAGADASARNNAGLSCADEARSQQNEAIADLLDAQSGANPQTSSNKVAATPPRPSPARSSHRTSWRGKGRAAPGRPTTMGVDQRLRCLEDVPFLKPLTGGERPTDVGRDGVGRRRGLPSEEFLTCLDPYHQGTYPSMSREGRILTTRDESSMILPSHYHQGT